MTIYIYRFHNMSPPDLSVVGAHAYSENGLNWTFVGVSYNNVVKFDDGSSVGWEVRSVVGAAVVGVADGVGVLNLEGDIDGLNDGEDVGFFGDDRLGISADGWDVDDLDGIADEWFDRKIDGCLIGFDDASP